MFRSILALHLLEIYLLISAQEYTGHAEHYGTEALCEFCTNRKQILPNISSNDEQDYMKLCIRYCDCIVDFEILRGCVLVMSTQLECAYLAANSILLTAHPRCEHVTLTDPDGYITSPNYPDPYDDNLDCQWLIKTDSSNRIVVYFVEEFHTQTGFDRITLRDGEHADSPILLEWSGHELFYPWISSHSNVMLIQFTSFRGSEFTGFKLRYYTEAKPLCGGLLEDDSGMLTCPPFSAEPNYYDNNVDCQWLIQGLTHQNILFQFHEFSTEPGRDIVTVIDPMLNSTTVLTHSGRSIPGPILSKGNSLVVRFKSDAYMHDILGFRAQYFKVHNEWL